MNKLMPDIINLVSWARKNLEQTSKNKFEEYFFWHHPITENCHINHWSEDPPHYKVVVNFVRDDFHDIVGSAGWDSSSVATIELNVYGQNRRFIPKLNSNLINVFAHELQHFTQKDMPFERPGFITYTSADADSEDSYKYFSCGNEAEAFASGFLYESKMTNTDFNQIAGSFLQRFVFENRLLKTEKEKIIEIWNKSIKHVL